MTSGPSPPPRPRCPTARRSKTPSCPAPRRSSSRCAGGCRRGGDGRDGPRCNRLQPLAKPWEEGFDAEELLDFEAADRYDERQKAALTYARAIAWSPEEADDELWERLHLHFSDEELVELGYFIGVTLGQQSWIRTLDIGHHEVLDVSAE